MRCVGNSPRSATTALNTIVETEKALCTIFAVAWFNWAARIWMSCDTSALSTSASYIRARVGLRASSHIRVAPTPPKMPTSNVQRSFCASTDMAQWSKRDQQKWESSVDLHAKQVPCLTVAQCGAWHAACDKTAMLVFFPRVESVGRSRTSIKTEGMTRPAME